MNATPNRPVNPRFMEMRGKFVGYLNVNGPRTFMVPIQEFKPLNPHKASLTVGWKGPKETEFEFGAFYSLMVDTKEWETETAIKLG